MRSLLIDPTLALTRRGSQWLERISGDAAVSVAVPGSLLRALERSDAAALSIYQPPSRFGFADWPLRLPLSITLHAPSRPFDEVSELLLRSQPCQQIVCDIWYALSGGAVLAARRLPTFNQLVQAGVLMKVEGRDQYRERVSSLAAEFGADHIEALARRTRYFAVRSSGSGLDGERRPTVHVCDAGTDGYHLLIRII
jgi:hypothetical protein